MKKRNLFCLLSCAAMMSTVFSPAHAEGQLMVLPASLSAYNGHKTEVTVKNVGDAPMYLNVDLMRIENPGKMPERKTAIKDIAKPELMASPNKITLGPNQTRKIELISLSEPKQETAYRLYTIPVKSIKVVGEPVKDKISAPLSFSIGYGVLVFHKPAPAHQKTGLSRRCENGGMTLSATGNMRELLTGATMTPPDSSYKEKPGDIKLAVFPGTDIHLKTTKLEAKDGKEKVSLSCP